MVALACMQLFSYHSYHTARSKYTDGQTARIVTLSSDWPDVSILASDWPVCPVEAVLSNPAVQRRPGPGDGQTRCK